MAKNRLKLDWQLEYADERNEFVVKYLADPIFTAHPPTPDELETISNYILWGKDRATGLNPKQSKTIQLSSRNHDWDESQCDSLDELMESPTFNEASLVNMTSAPATSKKEVFSRDEALANCPESLAPIFRELFHAIDELELTINFYELAHGKREKPPREALLRKFDEEAQTTLRETASHWNQFSYLKQRHNLVEMRRQQYTLRDSYTSQAMPHNPPSFCMPIEQPTFEDGIEVLPLGLCQDTPISKLVFRDWQDLTPEAYNEKQLRLVMKFYWEKREFKKEKNVRWFDFRDAEQVYRVFLLYEELGNDAGGRDWDEENGVECLMRAMRFYVDAADLTDAQRDILEMKLAKVKNADIARDINKKYGKSYTPNYISTIFKQRIIPKITEVAEYHTRVVENLPFEEEFKVCTCCGKKLLRDPINFTHKARSKDGYTTKCKKCEKLARNGKEVSGK